MPKFPESRQDDLDVGEENNKLGEEFELEQESIKIEDEIIV